VSEHDAPIDRDEFDGALLALGVRLPLDRAADRPVVPVPALVNAFAELIGSDDRMIAASYAFQSVVSRLAAPVLTGAVAFGWAPSFSLMDVRWGVGVYGPTIGAGDPPLRPASPEGALDALLELVEAWATAMRADVRIAHRLLMGNAAASLLASLRRIAALRGVDAAAIVAVAERAVVALGSSPVATLLEVDGWTTFQRRTCCLLRFAGARGVCEECSFLDRPTLLDAQRAVRRGLGIT
jgi:hypothetical protein